MARDSQAALVALNRFGLGARGGASGDFLNAASDPRGFHGTVALLAGGAVKGGRVIADWPGLKPANLYQARDLAPTTDLRAVMKGVLKDQFGLAEKVLAESVFPDGGVVKPMQGLVG